MTILNIAMLDCEGEKTLEYIYTNLDNQVLCLLNDGTYVAGELEWEQGHAPNHYVKCQNLRYSHEEIKSIGTLPIEDVKMKEDIFTQKKPKMEVMCYHSHPLEFKPVDDVVRHISKPLVLQAHPSVVPNCILQHNTYFSYYVTAWYVEDEYQDGSCVRGLLIQRDNSIELLNLDEEDLFLPFIDWFYIPSK